MIFFLLSLYKRFSCSTRWVLMYRWSHFTSIAVSIGHSFWILLQLRFPPWIIYIYIYIYVCVCVCVCVLRHLYTGICLWYCLFLHRETHTQRHTLTLTQTHRHIHRHTHTQEDILLNNINTLTYTTTNVFWHIYIRVVVDWYCLFLHWDTHRHTCTHRHRHTQGDILLNHINTQK